MKPSAETLLFALAVRSDAGEVALEACQFAWESFDLACSLADVQKAPLIKYKSELRTVSEVDTTDSQKMLLAMRALSDFAAGLAQGEPVFAVDKLDVRNTAELVRYALRKGLLD